MTSLKWRRQCNEVHSRCSIKVRQWITWKAYRLQRASCSVSDPCVCCSCCAFRQEYLLLPSCYSSKSPLPLQLPRSLLSLPGSFVLIKFPLTPCAYLSLTPRLYDTFHTDISKPQGIVCTEGNILWDLGPIMSGVSREHLPCALGTWHFDGDVLTGILMQPFWGRHCDAAVLTGTFWWDVWMKPYLCFFFFPFYQFILLANGKNKTLHSIPWENLPTDRRWFKMEGGQPWENWAGTSGRSTVTKSVVHSRSSQKRPSIIPGNGSGHLWEYLPLEWAA